MKTLVLLKPDAVENKLVGQLLARFEDSFTLTAVKTVRMGGRLCRLHYEEHLSKDFYPKLEEFMTSGPLVAVVLDGDVATIRALGKAMRSEFHPEYAGGPRNLIHASDSEESARREVALWFPELTSEKTS